MDEGNVQSVAKSATDYLEQVIRAEVAGRDRKPFRFVDKGQMATIGRHAAVAEFPGDIRFAGTFAWFTWLILHLAVLFGFKNRMHVLISWICSYFSNCRGARLILNEPTSMPAKTKLYRVPNEAIRPKVPMRPKVQRVQALVLTTLS